MQTSNCTVSLPGRAPVNVLLYGAARPSGGATAATPSISVVNIASSDLEVVVVAPTSSSAQPTPAPIDVTKIIDTSAPVITLLGDSFTPVLQAERFVDVGTRVQDNIDGNSINALARIQLCARPSGDLLSIPANDSRPLLRCGPQLAGIDTTSPSRDNETFVITYTARDAARNQAVPLRRYVTVTARCVDKACQGPAVRLQRCASVHTCVYKN